MKFWLQTQAPAGNWVDSLGTTGKDAAIEHGKWLLQKTDAIAVRVIERTDVEIWQSNDKES